MTEKLRILILEDREADAQLTEGELRRSGFDFSAQTVRTRDEFFKARGFPAHARVGGLHAAGFRRPGSLECFLRQHSDHPFIIVSGTIGDEKAAELIKNGATDFVPRDRLEKLGAAVRALREAAARRERRQAELLRQSSEARFRALFESAGSGIAIEDLQGKIIQTNRALQQMLGYEAAERGHHAAGLHAFAGFEGGNGALQAAALGQVRPLPGGKAVRAPGRPHLLGAAHGLDGARRRSGAAIHRGDDRGHHGTAARRGGAHAVRVDRGIFQRRHRQPDAGRDYFQLEPGAERLFGYTSSEANGRPISLITPQDREQEANQIIERMKRGEYIDSFETTRLRKDGLLIHVSATTSPIKDASGAIVGASSIYRDITERKRAEEVLRESGSSPPRKTSWQRPEPRPTACLPSTAPMPRSARATLLPTC